MKDFSQLCKPAKIYFAIAVVATMVALFNHVPIVIAVYKLIFAFIWTFILSFICDKGYVNISWFLVALPYIIIALAMFDIYHVPRKHKQFMRQIHLQGAYGR